MHKLYKGGVISQINSFFGGFLKMTSKLPELEYSYDALEPYIDAKTMEIHHSKHHKAYVDKLNAALEGKEELQERDIDDILKDLNSVPEEIRTAVVNNGGGHSNHRFFWKLLKKDVSFEGEVAEAIKQKYGSFEEFKKKFSETAIGRFGSGWAWLVLNNGELEIINTVNQDSPFSDGKVPLLTLDVWEHAYYLKYQNRRPDYVEAFFNVTNWEKVNENFKNSQS